MIQHFIFFRPAIYVLTAALFLQACGGGKNLARPENAPRKLADLPVSEINIPIKIYLKPILNRMDSSTARQFTSDKWPAYFQSSCDFRYRYRFLRSPFSFACVNNKVSIRFRGNYQIAGSKTVCAFGKQISPWVSGSCGFGDESMRRVDLTIHSQLDLLPTHQVRTITWLDKLNPIDKCEMTLLQTDMTGEIMDSIRASVESYTKTFDQFIQDLNNNPLLQTWRSGKGLVMPLSNYGFLNLNPSQYRVGKFNYSGDTLRFSVGFTGYPAFSSDSLQLVTNAGLPPVRNENVPGSFSTYVNAVYGYEFFNRLLNDSLQNKPFDVDGKTLVIKNVNVSGNNNGKMMIDLAFSGYKSGVLHLSGTPVLDSATQLLTMPDINFALESRDVLVNMAKGLFRKKILKELKTQTAFDIAALVEQNKEAISARLNQPVNEWMSSAGQLKQLRLIGILPQQNHVQVQFYINADLSLIASPPPSLLFGF